RDWSSDVCSSDLVGGQVAGGGDRVRQADPQHRGRGLGGGDTPLRPARGLRRGSDPRAPGEERRAPGEGTGPARATLTDIPPAEPEASDSPASGSATAGLLPSPP